MKHILRKAIFKYAPEVEKVKKDRKVSKGRYGSQELHLPLKFSGKEKNSDFLKESTNKGNRKFL